MPAVSVLIPTFEPKPEHLRAAIDSVLAQTFPDWELIIHDDASTVDVASMIPADPRIRFVKSPTRLRIGGNWNASIACASAPLVQLLFQDDWWEPQYLEKAVEAMQNDPSLLFVTAHHRYVIEGAFADTVQKKFDAWAAQMRKVTPGAHENAAFLKTWLAMGLHPNIIGEPSFVMLRRSTIDRVGEFDRIQKQSLDMDYWIRCLLLPGKFSKLGDDLGAFRVHAGGTSARNAGQNQGFIDRLRIFDKLLNIRSTTFTPTEVRESLVAQLALMGRRFRMRNTAASTGTVGKPKLSALLSFLARHPLLTLRGILRSFSREN